MTTIEWTNDTWNPIAGCSVVSPGCTNCYAMRRVAPRLSGNPATPHYHGTVQPSKAGPVWTGKIGIASEAVLTKPLRWKKPRMIFVNSTSDLFHEDVPDEVIDRVLAVMALSPQHTFQVLTKRADRMREYVSALIIDHAHNKHPGSKSRLETAAEAIGRELGWDHDRMRTKAFEALNDGPLPNVWLGVSVEDQTRANERIPDLLATPAAIRFISAEPLLGPVDLTRIEIHPNKIDQNGRLARSGIRINAVAGKYAESGMPYIGEWDINKPYPIGAKKINLDWVIVGGESGNGARPMHPDWARQIRDQCAAASVPFFFKQWGEWAPTRISGREADPNEKVIAVFFGGDSLVLRKLGKSAAGRVLDGKLHDAMLEAK